MSEGIQKNRIKHNEEYIEDVVYNIESYSEESADPDSDPFAAHCGKVMR